MTHKDSMGNETLIKKGEVQRMSAGTGLTHSEFNLAEKPVHFYQIWIRPDNSELEPSYHQLKYDEKMWDNKLFPVASGQNIPEIVTFHTDATIYRSKLESTKEIEHFLSSGRRVFIYVTYGSISIDGNDLHKNDQARVDTEGQISIKGFSNNRLLIELRRYFEKKTVVKPIRYFFLCLVFQSKF